MDYAVRRDDEAVSERIDEPWGSLMWLAGSKLGNARGLTLGRVVIAAGSANPRHAHDGCEEALYLMAGEIEHTVGPETVTLRAGDTLVVPAGLMHNARSVGDVDADMIVAYSSAERDFRLEDE